MSFSKAHIGVLIVAILMVSAFGVGFSGLLMGHDDMNMIGCPLMGHDVALCPMNPLAHITAWQNLFAAIPTQGMMMLLLLLLALFFFLRFNQHLWLLHPSPHLVHISYDPEVVTHRPLQRFIARGLMHPKIF